MDGNPRNNIAVANMSLSGPEEPDDERCGRTVGDAAHYAICGLTDAGVTSVGSAGNETKEFTGDGPSTYSEVLTATAMADFDGEPGGLAPPDCYGVDYGQYGEADDTSAVFSNWAVLPVDAAHQSPHRASASESTFIDSDYAIWTEPASRRRRFPQSSPCASTRARAPDARPRRSSGRSRRTPPATTNATRTTATRAIPCDRSTTGTTAS